MSVRRRPGSPVTVELTDRALQDLCDIERYSAEQWGRRVADKYLGDVQAALDRIQQHPELLRVEPDIIPGLQFHRVRKHFLVCNVDDQRIVVLTVIHTSMDLPSRLVELQPLLAVEAELLRKQLDQRSNKR